MAQDRLDSTGLSYLWGKLKALFAPQSVIGDTPMGTTATTVTGAIAEHEQDLADLNSKFRFYLVTMPNTGSVAANSNKTVTKPVSDFLDPGYSVVLVSPIYSGDDQFCWVNCDLNGSNVTAQIRNVSSVADSGAPTIKVMAQKN